MIFFYTRRIEGGKGWHEGADRGPGRDREEDRSFIHCLSAVLLIYREILIGI